MNGPERPAALPVPWRSPKTRGVWLRVGSPLVSPPIPPSSRATLDARPHAKIRNVPNRGEVAFVSKDELREPQKGVLDLRRWDESLPKERV